MNECEECRVLTPAEAELEALGFVRTYADEDGSEVWEHGGLEVALCRWTKQGYAAALRTEGAAYADKVALHMLAVRMEELEAGL